jgi:hypothetical protein
MLMTASTMSNCEVLALVHIYINRLFELITCDECVPIFVVNNSQCFDRPLQHHQEAYDHTLLTSQLHFHDQRKTLIPFADYYSAPTNLQLEHSNDCGCKSWQRI